MTAYEFVVELELQIWKAGLILRTWMRLITSHLWYIDDTTPPPPLASPRFLHSTCFSLPLSRVSSSFTPVYLSCYHSNTILYPSFSQSIPTSCFLSIRVSPPPKHACLFQTCRGITVSLLCIPTTCVWNFLFFQSMKMLTMLSYS